MRATKSPNKTLEKYRVGFTLDMLKRKGTYNWELLKDDMFETNK